MTQNIRWHRHYFVGDLLEPCHPSDEPRYLCGCDCFMPAAHVLAGHGENTIPPCEKFQRARRAWDGKPRWYKVKGGWLVRYRPADAHNLFVDGKALNRTEAEVA